MTTPSLKLADPPELTDATASETLEFLYQLIQAIETQYAENLRRYYQPTEPPPPDLFEDLHDLDDGLPPF